MGLHYLVGGGTSPGYNLLRFHLKSKNVKLLVQPNFHLE